MSAASASGQAPVSPPTFAQGDVVRFALRAVSSVEQGPIRYRLDQRAVMRCEADQAQGGEQLFLCGFEALEISRDAGEASERFDWPAGADEAAAEEVAASPLAIVNEALAQSTLRVWVGADGSVSRVEGYAQAAQAMTRAPEAEGSIMGALSPGAASRNLAPIFGGDLPTAEEAAGAAGWTRSRSVNAGPGRTLEMTTRWQRVDREDGSVALSGATSMELSQDDQPGGLDAQTSLHDVDAGVETAWDAAAGRLIERRSWLRMTTKVTMGQISATQRLDSAVQLRGLPANAQQGGE